MTFLKNWKSMVGVALMIFAIVFIGCSKKHEETAESADDTGDETATAAAGPAQAVDVAAGAMLSGKITFAGGQPVMQKIQMGHLQHGRHHPQHSPVAQNQSRVERIAVQGRSQEEDLQSGGVPADPSEVQHSPVDEELHCGVQSSVLLGIGEGRQV